ncbi:MAG: M48 family metalloprotease [Oligoflexia bacterium]|nr:M48 family metalloprotease [Oligoflexia bacterium]
MQKMMSQTLVFLLTLTIGFSQSFAADPMDDRKLYFAEENIFRKLMNNPALAEEYQNLQSSMLSTRTDRNLRGFFMTQPLMQPLLEIASMLNDSTVETYVAQGSINMLGIQGEKSTPQHEMIDKLVIEVARELGFSDGAIQNRKVFVVAGDANAATVSASSDNIFILLHSGLIHSMTPDQLRTVLAHELMHIRLKHNIVSFMNETLLSAIASEIGVGGSGLSLNVKEELFKNRMKRVAFKTMNPQKVFGVGKKHIANSEAEFEKFFTSNFISNGQFAKILQQIQIYFAKMPEQERDLLFNSYLEIIDLAVERAQRPAHIVEFTKGMRAALNSKNSAQVLDIKQFSRWSDDVGNMISRENELSADRGGATTGRHEDVAAAFAKLFGIQFESEHQEAVLELAIKRATEFYMKYGPQVRAQLISGSHPPLILRMATILNLDKFSTRLFGHEYLKLLTFEQTLREKVEVIDIALVGEKDIEFKIILGKIKADIAQGLEILQNALLDLMVREVASSGGVPRIKYFLEYQLAMREIKINVYNSLISHRRQSIKSFKDQMPEDAFSEQLRQTDMLEVQLRNSLSKEDSFAQKLRSRLFEVGKSTEITSDSKKMILQAILNLNLINTSRNIEDVHQIKLLLPYRDGQPSILPTDLQSRLDIPGSGLLHKGPITKAKLVDDNIKNQTPAEALLMKQDVTMRLSCEAILGAIKTKLKTQP